MWCNPWHVHCKFWIYWREREVINGIESCLLLNSRNWNLWAPKNHPCLRGFLSGKPTNHFFTSMQEGLQLACFVYQNGSTMAFIFPGMSNPWKWSYQEKQHVKRKEKQKSKEPFPFFFKKKNSLFFMYILKGKGETFAIYFLFLVSKTD